MSYGVAMIGAGAQCLVSLIDASGVYRVQRQSGCEGVLVLNDANLWWPRHMHTKPGYLYTFEVYKDEVSICRRSRCGIFQVELTDNLDGSVLDVYRMPMGVRSIYYNSTSLLVNERPVYIRGVGRHEDADVCRSLTYIIPAVMQFRAAPR